MPVFHLSAADCANITFHLRVAAARYDELARAASDDVGAQKTTEPFFIKQAAEARKLAEDLER